MVCRPATPPAPPSRALACVSLPISCWELTGGHAEARGGGVTGGFVTPHTSRNNDYDHCFLFTRGRPHPPESTLARLAFSPLLGSIRGLFVCLFATIQHKLGPPRLGIFVFSALSVLHLFSPCQMGWGIEILGVFLSGLFLWNSVWAKQHEMLPVFRVGFCLVVWGGSLAFRKSSLCLRVVVGEVLWDQTFSPNPLCLGFVSVSIVARNAALFFRCVFLWCLVGRSFRGSVKVLSVLGSCIMTNFGGPNGAAHAS